MYKSRVHVVVIFVLVLVIVTFCLSRKVVRITGETMGTTYNIKIVTGFFNSKRNLEYIINCRLMEINSSLSTYDTASEISQFNAIRNLEEKFYPSDDFLNLLLISRKLHELTGDVWDPSIDPIVNAWGFGRDGPKKHILKKDQLNLLLGNVGFKRAIVFCTDGSVKKGLLNASIDLASIAKGFGVDQIALLLQEYGFENFLVEIGGEICAKGCRKDGQYWQIGIDYPDKTPLTDKIHEVISLSDRAIATSGDYRNFFRINGKTYSHIIDPRTGYPISNCVTSVSVIAGNCTLADGLATALMVFDPLEAVALINTLPTVECIITVLKEDRCFKKIRSSGMEVSR